MWATEVPGRILACSMPNALCTRVSPTSRRGRLQHVTSTSYALALQRRYWRREAPLGFRAYLCMETMLSYTRAITIFAQIDDADWQASI